MVNRRIILFGFTMLCVCGVLAAQTPQVYTAGEIRKVMRDGDLRPTMDLTDFAPDAPVYAIGPVEGLQGEITVWNGRPSIARVQSDTVSVASTFEVRASFLVYAEVPSWQEVPIPAEVQDLAGLENFVARAAVEHGIDVNDAFPFGVRGVLPYVAYHVVNKTDTTTHSREKCEQVQVHFSLENADVRLLGFYSDHHHGIFTHHGSNMHVHMVTADGRKSGHLESATLSSNAVLLLPKL
ncbi:acetolactate decarboxylase [bacterium]|nr:acetolactate decarboxylase [bacterium]